MTFTLEGANGNFPYLVSIYNAQSLITPADYVAGTTLDSRPAGTGAWKLTSYDQRAAPRSSGTPTGGAARRRSTASECVFFDATGPMVTA